MSAAAKCPVCGAACADLFESTDYISGERFKVCGCARRHLAHTEISPDADLAKYYGASYYGDAGARFPAIVERAIVAFRGARARRMHGYSPAPGRALDIGCGRALTLALLKQRGWQVQGTEFEPALADAALRKYGIEVRVAPSLAGCGFETHSFDLISMYHVLEHVRDLDATVDEIVRILKPGGAVEIEVPNLQSWQAAIGGGAWFHLDVPRHLTHIGSDALRHALTRRGLVVFSSSTHSLEYGYYGMLQTLLNRLTGSMNLIYGALKRVKNERAPVAQARVAAHAVLAALLLPFAVALEAAAVLGGRGTVIRMAARS